MKTNEFSTIFSDRLNRLELAVSVLEAGLENAYSGNASFVLEHEGSHGKTARLEVEAWSQRSWGMKTPQTFDAKGYIHWTTSSGHTVLFLFEKEDGQEPALTSVLIGTDKSEVFYPEILRKVSEAGVPWAYQPSEQLLAG